LNRLVLAVAGGRKTQSIVDHAIAAPAGRRILILTYTQRNQRELHERLSGHRPLPAVVEVRGWFSFLLGEFVRPYLPRHFAGMRLRGLDFHGDPGRYAAGPGRFLDADGRAYKRHLAKLAVDVNAASGGAVLDRLRRIYDELHIDEVQDLNGYDLDILLSLMRSPR
jgi:ATP-dependent DNA helicase UvrD/PcrA